MSAILSAAVTAAATIEFFRPFSAPVHAWGIAVLVCVAGVSLLAASVQFLLRTGGRFASVGAFGGALLAATFTFAAFLIGQPQRMPAAPGQTYRPPHGGRVEVVFPDIVGPGRSAAAWPDSVTIVNGSRASAVRPGETIRSGAFVFAASSGPIAGVDVRSSTGAPVTVTQPDGPAFLSRYLTFPGLDGDRPEDFFRIPAAHRDVQVDYWPGLPARGINIPFLAVRISAQNDESGKALFEGVAIAGRPLRAAGVELVFELGVYPLVTAASAPPLVPYWTGIVMVVGGWIGHLLERRRNG